MLEVLEVPELNVLHADMFAGSSGGCGGDALYSAASYAGDLEGFKIPIAAVFSLRPTNQNNQFSYTDLTWPLPSTVISSNIRYVRLDYFWIVNTAEIQIFPCNFVLLTT